MYADTIPFLNS